ncbi:flavodoxin family protein [Candidatus Thorarchaeota archaeon]|nr:MAG: flavodoxin family protein [Candidatus Thorarchaeota archaeon]
MDTEVLDLKTRILGISGSPRANGNTSTLIETSLNSAKNEDSLIEFIDLSELTINECKHCNECYRIGKCVQKDDLNNVAERMLLADGIIFGSPCHHASIASALKNLMDRTGRFLHLEGKVSCGFVVGRRSGVDIALASILFFINVKEMILPGGVSWPIGYALNPGDIRADTEAMAMAAQMGKRVMQLASILVKNPVSWSYEPRPNGQKVRFGDEWK